MHKNDKNNIRKRDGKVRKALGNMSALMSEKGLLFLGRNKLKKLINFGDWKFLRNSWQHFHHHCHFHCHFSLDWNPFSDVTVGCATISRHVQTSPFLFYFDTFSVHLFEFYFLQSFSIIQWKVPWTAEIPPFRRDLKDHVSYNRPHMSCISHTAHNYNPVQKGSDIEQKIAARRQKVHFTLRKCGQTSLYLQSHFSVLVRNEFVTVPHYWKNTDMEERVIKQRLRRNLQKVLQIVVSWQCLHYFLLLSFVLQFFLHTFLCSL